MNQIVPYKGREVRELVTYDDEQRRYLAFICVCRQFRFNAIFNLIMNLVTVFVVFGCFRMATYQPEYVCGYSVMGVCLERHVTRLSWRGAIAVAVGDMWLSVAFIVMGFAFLFLQSKNTSTSARDINNSMKMILKSSVAI